MSNPLSACPWPGDHVDYQHYHDTEWGVPCYDNRKLFEKLCLEGQQAGLSWLVVLRKREHYRRCFHGFDPHLVAEMTDARLDELVQDAGLIRHRAKLTAVRTNARAYVQLEAQGVDFAQWLWSFVDGQPKINRWRSMDEVPAQTAESLAMSKALKKAGFVFVGPIGCYAFMQSMGLVNDHLLGCPEHPQTAKDISAGEQSFVDDYAILTAFFREAPMSKRLKICINTGGGDAPGLNAVIEAVTMAAHHRQWEVYGIKSGYAGLLNTNDIVRLTPKVVDGIAIQGGTILGSTNKGNPFRMPVCNVAGDCEERDLSDKVIENFQRLGFDALVSVGGDGSMEIAKRFADRGIPVIGVPKTIDNDLGGTELTFGFDTATGIATEAIDRLHSTAKSHDRIMVVEVMGRDAGFIALNSGISGNADVILIPEIPFDISKVCTHLMANELNGRKYGIVVVAEGAVPKDGEAVVKSEGELGRQHVVLGGIAEYVAKEIAERTGKDTRSLVLGHLQRGGSPTTFDRLLALRFGAAAVRAIEAGKFGQMVALKSTDIALVPMEKALSADKRVDPKGDTVLTARDMDISFGD